MTRMYHGIYRIGVLFLNIALLPLACLIALIIVLQDGFPVFFCQKRTGLAGKPFILYKFRTMIVGADRQQKQLLSRNEAHSPVFKIYDDPRFTNVGKILSHTGLDELPQLYNVLRGEMTLIGPRPLPLAEASKLSAWQRKRHQIKPGIISPWVLDGYHRQSFEAWMHSDIAYAQNKNFWGDVRLFCRALAFLGWLMIREVSV